MVRLVPAPYDRIVLDFWFDCLVIILIIPPIASDPYNELPVPRTISMRSISDILIRCSTFVFASCGVSSPEIRSPSMRNRVWEEDSPRICRAVP